MNCAFESDPVPSPVAVVAFVEALKQIRVRDRHPEVDGGPLCVRRPGS